MKRIVVERGLHHAPQQPSNFPTCGRGRNQPRRSRGLSCRRSWRYRIGHAIYHGGRPAEGQGKQPIFASLCLSDFVVKRVRPTFAWINSRGGSRDKQRTVPLIVVRCPLKRSVPQILSGARATRLIKAIPARRDRLIDHCSLKRSANSPRACQMESSPNAIASCSLFTERSAGQTFPSAVAVDGFAASSAMRSCVLIGRRLASARRAASSTMNVSSAQEYPADSLARLIISI